MFSEFINKLKFKKPYAYVVGLCLKNNKSVRDIFVAFRNNGINDTSIKDIVSAFIVSENEEKLKTAITNGSLREYKEEANDALTKLKNATGNKKRYSKGALNFSRRMGRGEHNTGV